MARKQKTIHYLYKTTCLVTNRYYIGMHSTSNLEDGYMGSGLRLRHSIRKYGVDNHKKEIIEFFENRELLVEAEIKAITSEMVMDKDCMNLKGGGNGGFISEEHQKKCTKASNDIQRIKFFTDETFRLKRLKVLSEIGKKTKNLRNDTFKGKKHSEESKKKMGETKKKNNAGVGEKNSQYGTCWITKDGVNKKIKKEDLEIYEQDGWIKGRK